jgi:hypothetical protein
MDTQHAVAHGAAGGGLAGQNTIVRRERSDFAEPGPTVPAA